MNNKKQDSTPLDGSIDAKISQRIDVLYPDVVSWRRHLHRHPEPGFQEYETTRWITGKLEKWGYEVHHPCETGCVAVLKGEKPADRVIALRADIDALPIEEQGEAKQEFLSENKGVAHCCGHDIHTSNLLGTAFLLSELREEIRGTVVLIFQAAEEVLPGGAKVLMETGFLQDLGIHHIYGLHTHPHYAPGQIAVKEGPLMAGTHEFLLTVKGKGGHAASPHLAVDPIVTAAQIVQQLQTIVSRHMDPTDASLLTVGKIHGGSARNVIPENVLLEGTIRSFDEAHTHRIIDLMTAMAEHTAMAAGGRVDVECIPGYPPVINHSETTRNVCKAAGEQLLLLEKPVMAGEDFAFYQKQFPGTFFFLGSGSNEADSRYSWHHPRFNADERCLKTGMSVMAHLVVQAAEL